MANSEQPPTGPTPQEVRTLFELVIRFDSSTGQMNVTGPIENKVLAYGMLEMARDVIEEHARKRGEPGLQIVRSPLPPNGVGG